jgi:hypothetical protein
MPPSFDRGLHSKSEAELIAIETNHNFSPEQQAAARAVRLQRFGQQQRAATGSGPVPLGRKRPGSGANRVPASNGKKGKHKKKWSIRKKKK